MDGKVIHAFPGKKDLPECPVDEERRPVRYCSHERITLVEHDRNLTCRDCGATLDAFQYLLDGARAIRRGWQEHKHVAQLIREKRDQLSKLEKDRKRLADQVRRLKEKTDASAINLKTPLEQGRDDG